MSQLSKQALKVENNTSFPNNNTNYITPAILRDYNVDIIDSMVDEIPFGAYTQSVDTSINALNAFTASASGLTTGSLLITASAAGNTITFTKGDASTFNVTVATGSIPDISNLNQATASLQAYTASANVKFQNLESTTASLNTSVTNINTFTASAAVSITNLNSVSASQQTSINNLNGATGSYATTGSNTFTGANTFTSISASSFISASQFVGDGSKLTGLTSSISMPILDEGVPQGNAVSLNFTGSAIGATVVGGVAIISVNGLDTGSYNQLTASFNSFTASTNSDLAAIHQATASLQAFTSSFSTSSLVTTSSFNAYTASNDQRVSSLEANSASVNTSVANLNSATASLFTSASLTLVTASINNDDITFTKGDGTQFTIQVATGSFALSASYAETSSITRNVVVVARNNNASTLGAGTVVHITSAVGDNPIFTTASYDTEALSSNTFGLLRYSSPSGADVEVVVNGVVTGVNTDPALGFAAGDVLYLSSSGQFTNVQPQAPNQIVTLGQVLRAQQNNGSIYVSINNGWELNELHNVQITSPQTNQLLAYESASYGLWKNKSFSDLGLATTGSNTFNGNQTINGFVSASGDLYGANVRVGDTGNFRFLSGSSYYNVQLVPGTAGDLAFSRDGVSNTKTLVLAGADGNTTSFQNNPVSFESTVSGVTFNQPIVVNNGINSNVQITGSAIISSGLTAASATINGAASIGGNLTVTPLSLATNAQYIIPFISGGIVSKDSVDTLFYNPSTNQLQVSASATGVATLSPNVISFVSGSGNTQQLSSMSKTSVVSSVEGYNIGMSGNPSKIGAPSLASNTKPAIFALSSSAVPYVAIELEPSQSFTDGRVTFPRNVAMLQNLEITGSLTASLSQGYVWVGDANNKTTLVATSSFSGGGGSVPAGTVSGSAQILAYNIFATTGSNTFVGNQTISGSARVTGSVIASKVGAYDFDSLFYGSQLGGTIANGTFFGYGSTDYSFILGAYSGVFDSELKISADNTGITFGDFNGAAYPSFLKLLPNTGANPKPIMTRGLEVTGSTEVGTFTASLANGYVWVGAANGRTTTVATSSFGGGGAAFPYAGTASISGSLQVTGSVSGLPITLSVVASTASIDMTAGNTFVLNIPTGSTTHIVPTNIIAGQTINLLLKQAAGATTGSIAWSPLVLFPGGNDMVATATGSANDLVSMISFDTTNLMAANVKNLK